MLTITAPLQPGDSGRLVANLQQALLGLVERRVIWTHGAPEQPISSELEALVDGVKGERERLHFGDATRGLVSYFQRQQGLGDHSFGSVDGATAEALNRFLEDGGEVGELVVKGSVRLVEGPAPAGLRVSVVARRLRNEPTLGEGFTNGRGFYQVQYPRPPRRVDDERNGDVVVKVWDADGSLLVASPVLYDAPVVAEIDLVIPAEVRRPPTLFERIAQGVEPWLEGVAVIELEEDGEHGDLSFLSAKTGLERSALVRFALAHRLARRGLPAELWFVLLRGSLHQFSEGESLAVQTAAVLDRLPSQSAAVVTKAIVGGLNDREIPDWFADSAAAWTNTLLELVAQRLVGDTRQPTLVKAALAEAGIERPDRQERFARLFLEHKALTPDLLQTLRADPSFEQSEIADLETTFRLAEITRGDVPVVIMLKKELRRNDGPRTLAKRSEGEWVKLVRTKHAAGEIDLPVDAGAAAERLAFPGPELYAKTLARQFREAFPTAAFVGGLERALMNGGAGGVRHGEALRRFFEGHHDFELTKTPVDAFLDNGVHPDFKRLATDEPFRLELKAIQRIFKLVPTFEGTETLLADGLHSGQAVYRLGETQFVERYAGRAGFTANSARLAWRRAADTYAAALTVVGDLKAFEGEGLPFALKAVNPTPLPTFPNWGRLFRTGDLCECEHCGSVLGPSAYFADLLMFLRDRHGSSNISARDVLFRRRPDLGYLELSCANATTPLPYVDVVCEVLESVVAAGGDDLVFRGLSPLPAAPDIAKELVRRTFLTHEVSLGMDYTLTQVTPGDQDRLVARNDAVTYLLEKRPGSNDYAVRLLPNTKVSAAELRAHPQHVSAKAYDQLRAARHPFTLPFDLDAEVVRACFQKANLQRWDVMRTFRGRAAPNDASDAEIAADYLGISADRGAVSDEKRLIFTADAAGQQTIWGEPGNPAWLNAVRNVKTFLRKTGLEYEELFALLDLKFINPKGDIEIDHNGTCDTDRKSIDGLDAEKLDRIHRFIRLWRKLKGWQMWELDLVIRPGQGIGEPLLIELFHICDLRNRLGRKTTVEQVLALLGTLHTGTHFTGLNEPRADGLYQRLFLNKGLIHPLDRALAVDQVDVPEPTKERISSHLPALLGALGISEPDLAVLRALARASDGTAYITDSLTLPNLSFLWRHSWLAANLKLKGEDWRLLLKVLGQDLSHFGKPSEALQFLDTAELAKACGFTADELSWLLTADRSARAATKEIDAGRFLAGLRKELQRIRTEYSPEQYDVLADDASADDEQLVALLTTLLQKLNRSEAEVQAFLAALRGAVQLEAPAQELPANFIFSSELTGAPNYVPVQYDQQTRTVRFTGLMTDAQRTILLSHASLGAVASSVDYRSAIELLFERAQAAPGTHVSTRVAALAGVTLPTDRPSLPIRYDQATQRLTFVGLMTSAEQAALKAIATNPADAIDELFVTPRLAMKFFEPVFTAPLDGLPPAVDFNSQLAADLAGRVAYDAEQRLLRFTGILTKDARAALDALAGTVLPIEKAYHDAVARIATEPAAVVASDERVWMASTDLDATQGRADTMAKRLRIAIRKALGYLSSSLSASAVVTQAAIQLGLTEALTRALLSRHALLPATLLQHLTGALPATTGAVDYATLTTTFNGWFWAVRVAAVLKKWKVALEDLERILALPAAAQLLDFGTLPLEPRPASASSTQRLSALAFLRTSQLLRLRDSLPEADVTLLEVLGRLGPATYTASAFAADVQRLNPSWSSADVEALIASLDIPYPGGYVLVDSWERLRRAFSLLERLAAGAGTASTFAAVAMTSVHARTLKELLRSKLGSEAWLALSTEIQDMVRERKRDALVAFLLARPAPADAPTGKWDSPNDLYAYYLLDVEMGSCQLTSRLVQGSGSVQLFVQRCHMGLEPDVIVRADGPNGDSGWRWWTWMRKYRVWEANRKIFLWPENWIEPELKQDRSPFFRELESELLQSEVNQQSAETALANYLEKLDGVAQLEIAGFYQEDAGQDTILHVFGRTPGADPHLYYYRRFDYQQWTPWERVELDIQGDYLVPAVIHGQPFLFWPVFSEVPDEAANSAAVAIPATGASTMPAKANKRLRMQMAVSSYRQGKWTAKRVSSAFGESLDPHDTEIVSKHYEFFCVDRTAIDGRFFIKYQGASRVKNGSTPRAVLIGDIEVSSCRGAQDLKFIPGARGGGWPDASHATRPQKDATGDPAVFQKWVELEDRSDKPEDDLTLELNTSVSLGAPYTARVLTATPGTFAISPARHYSYMDLLAVDRSYSYVIAGTWLPFFYADKKRSFLVLPIAQLPGQTFLFYYPHLKGSLRSDESFFDGEVSTWVASLVAILTPTQKADLGRWLSWLANAGLPSTGNVILAPTDDELVELIKRFPRVAVHEYLTMVSNERLAFQKYDFRTFYHPSVCDFVRLLNDPRHGVAALMARETQLEDSGFRFSSTYGPEPVVVVQPGERVDFSLDGAYAAYNWELFFHAPLLIANALSKNQRFEEARNWYHFIFNPLGVESAAAGASPLSKYWITRPFFETTAPQYLQQRIEHLLRILAGDPTAPGFTGGAIGSIIQAVLDWRTHPFEPHRLASYRTVAYQKTVVMKYLDNLIAWGDFLFRQDSMESINEASQLYVLAAELLGPRPKRIQPAVKPPVQSFNELEHAFDAFSNALVQVENIVPVMPGHSTGGSTQAPLPTLYFCIPQNEKLLGYWDTVADRLYKIRHCMNIDGATRQLALFEPPIDPAALVKAVAGGLDIGAALGDLNAPLPVYRFNVLLQKANEVCADVRALGGALLAALEKKDSEALALLRQDQEIRLLEAIQTLRAQQIDEAKVNLEALKKSKAVVEAKRDYYQAIDKISIGEQMSLEKQETAFQHQQKAQQYNNHASILGLIPNITIGVSGVGGSPHVSAQMGTGNIISALQAAAGAQTQLSNAASFEGGRAGTLAGYGRRFDDWKLQERLADRELLQIDEQISAGELRIAIAEKELENQKLQIENAKATDEHMRSKYTNADLYQWQVGQISAVYFQSYQLAYDLAKRAERAFRFELGVQDGRYLNFGYWDSLKKGLPDVNYISPLTTITSPHRPPRLSGRGSWSWSG